MAVDPRAAEVFGQARKQDAASGLCFEFGTKDAEWASVSHGIYLSIGASGVHRSLGVSVSFVQSTTMDSWKPLHLRMMELGGNKRFAVFLRDHNVPEDMPIREKYRTRAAAWYRENLRAEAEGTELPVPLPVGVGHLPLEGIASDEMASIILDRVFAAAPTTSTPLRGKRVACQSSSFPDWFMEQICKIALSEGERTAEKLRTLSTGSMMGFGPEDAVLHLLRDACGSQPPIAAPAA